MNLSLLRRGLLQSRWVESRGGWEEGKIKASRERCHRSPRSRFLSPALPLLSFFFHWGLLTGASAEERGLNLVVSNSVLSQSGPIPFDLVLQSFTISYLEIPVISNCFSFPLGVRDHQSGKHRSIRYTEISEMRTGNFGGMDRAPCFLYETNVDRTLHPNLHFHQNGKQNIEKR